MQKDDTTQEIVNKRELHQFIASITFYLVVFNSQVFIKEGSKHSRADYALFASQRELFYDNEITGLSSKGIGSRQLSPTGLSIMSIWGDKWNRDAGGRIVWNYGDCWPIYMFDDCLGIID
ncbi:MAG: hypothetical protein ACQERB_00100 [Promethearchaeati archaeon]